MEIRRSASDITPWTPWYTTLAPPVVEVIEEAVERSTYHNTDKHVLLANWRKSMMHFEEDIRLAKRTILRREYSRTVPYGGTIPFV
jgi:hypothetical protein